MVVALGSTMKSEKVAIMRSLFGDKQLRRNQNSAITKDIKHCLTLCLLIDEKRPESVEGRGGT